MVKQCVILICVVCISVLVSACEKEPAPYGYTKTGSQKIDNITLEHFTGEHTEEKASRDFNKWLKDNGWKADPVKDKIEIAGYTGDVFKKKNDILILHINTSGQRSYITLISAPLHSYTSTTTQSMVISTPADTDVEGDDIDGIPRYPGSTRIKYEEAINIYGYISVEYVTTDSSEDIKSFYEEFLTDDSWDDPNMTYRGNTMHIQGIWDDFFVMITAEPSSLYENHVQIKIHKQGVFE